MYTNSQKYSQKMEFSFYPTPVISFFSPPVSARVPIQSGP